MTKKKLIGFYFKEGYRPRAKIVGGIGAYKSKDSYLELKSVEIHPDYQKMLRDRVTKTRIRRL